MYKKIAKFWWLVLIFVFPLILVFSSATGCGNKSASTVNTIRTAAFISPPASQTESDTGNIFYVALKGKPSGDGSKKSPWDLQTALSHPDTVKPGDTIYLRGGTYRGKFSSGLTGTPSNPITVRSYPGEWAKIDGYVTTTTTSPIPEGAKDQDVIFTVTEGSKFKEGDQITIDSEQFFVRSIVDNNVTAIHGWNGTVPASHRAGSLMILGGNQLEVHGSDTIYRDFEVTNSDPVRTAVTPNSQNAPNLRGEGLFHTGPRTRLINLVVHDCQDGIFSNANAIESEIYGCIVYNNGYEAGTADNGHGIYAINDRPTKRIINSVFFNNFADGIKCVSQNGDSKFIHLEGNVTFNNGSPPQRGRMERRFGILLGANNGTADENVVTRCFFYQPPRTVGLNAKLGYSGSNGSVVFTDNFVMGGAQALEVDSWKTLKVSGNTFYITDLNSEGSTNAILAQYTALPGASAFWNGNTYYNGRTVSNPNALYYNFSSAQDFATWQANSNFDANSTYQAGPLAGLQTFIQPNQYDPNLAYIIVYNWDRAKKVKVDVSSFLRDGDQYEIRNLQDYFGPSLRAGRFNGKALKLKMANLSVASPVGFDFTPLHTGPEFSVFALIRR